MSSPRAWGLSILLALAVFGALTTLPADAAGTTWTVTSSLDDLSGDASAHTGTLRFALAHAQAGDQVVFGDVAGSDSLFVGSPLSVPAGVSVGANRSQPCGSYSAPRRNLRALNSGVGPLVTLAAGATLRGVTVSGGESGVRVTGADVDICGVGFGIWVDGDGNTVSEPALHAALIVDGVSAWVHRSYLGGSAVVTVNGADTVLGDTLSSSGEANAATTNMAVTVAATANGAAQRVTIRDGYPRALQGLVGVGVAGGDDVSTHANNWSMTPAISSASVFGAAVTVSGSASPGALVDLYLAGVPPQRFATVNAAADGSFGYSGAGPGVGTEIYAVSTLNEAAHTNRRGSSSQLSARATLLQGDGQPSATPSATRTGDPTWSPTPSATRTSAPPWSPTPSATHTGDPTWSPTPTPTINPQLLRYHLYLPRLSSAPGSYSLYGQE